MPSTTTTARIAPAMPHPPQPTPSVPGSSPVLATGQDRRPQRRPQTTMAQTQCNPSSDPGTAGLPWARRPGLAGRGASARAPNLPPPPRRHARGSGGMSDNEVAAARVVAVLLADGWHRLVRGSFRVGPLSFGAEAGPGTPGFRFEEADADRPYQPIVLVDPLDSIIAVWQVTPASRHIGDPDWHLEDEPHIEPDPATEDQKFWVETRAEAQQLRDQAEAIGQDTADLDELLTELD
jgi:hypothetical protein